MGIRSFIKRKVEQKLSGGAVAPSSPPADTRPIPVGQDAEGYVAVMRESDLEVGHGRTVAVAGVSVAVFHLATGFHAIDDACTHEDAPLGEGVITGGQVLCPYHDWVFDIATGACKTDPSRPVGCFATKVNDGFVWVGRRTTEGTQLRGGDHADGLTTSEHAS
jgi:nitrite reductase (NADH) small subunit